MSIARCPKCGEEQSTFADPKGWTNIKCRRCEKSSKTKYWVFRPDGSFPIPPPASIAFITADKIPRKSNHAEVRE